MGRIETKFADLKGKNRTAFIAFITAGDPSLKATEELVFAFEKAGVDIIELGVPFSDPLADGSTIQASSQRALKNGVTLEKILRMVQRIRKRSEIPIALMTYYNPVFHYGEEAFVKRARQCGVDGVIIPDLPPEEAKDLRKTALANDFSTIFFLSPTTTPERMKEIIKASTGFIYYVSLAGVTGARRSIPESVLRKVRSAKRQTDKPICVGFGISTAAQVKIMSKIADGVIVGSAIINEIERNKTKENFSENVGRFVKEIIG